MYDNEFSENKVDVGENKTNIEYVNIIGLFGRYNVKVSLDNQVNIFIGENGLGKTTILNCVYYILKKKFLKLLEIQFLEIHVKFKKEKNSYIISVDDILEFKKEKSISLKLFENNILENELKSNKELELYEKEEKILKTGLDNLEDMSSFLEKNLKNSKFKKGNSNNVFKLEKAISKYIKQRIIYLPTYRRIESEPETFKSQGKYFSFGGLGLSEKEDSPIKFGMSDVKKSIDKILNEIRSIAMKKFSEMTRVLLKQYVDNKFLNSHKNIKVETLKIVLDRLGEEIEEEYKTKILDLVNDKKIKNNKYLLNLIEKLIDSYNEQKQYDDRIKKFSDTCNQYLNDKYFYYNQSTLSLEIFLDSISKENIIELTQLSSGEKQIISLFSKLYLESDENSIVIIDEPELSLSLKWQKMLLPDIIKTENCDLLLTVTHSPFIFDNEFDYYAKEIRKYINKDRGL
ncbi:AAA family ATPase [Fusobacterium polymorphum]|uniref:AAA family ATPase n=1 Tax=Fusobacterium nucleatum subsp. polymorphum TaxID=76857 RepID=UPI0030D2D986